MTKRRYKPSELTGYNAGLAKALVNSRARGASNHLSASNSGGAKTTAVRHTASPQKQPALESKTHESDVQQLLTNAELANTTFETKRNDVKLLASNGTVAISSMPKTATSDSLQNLNDHYGHLLRIPRRPRPGTYEDAEQLNALESMEFVAWRRQLAKLSEANVVITPFERNLEIWRQLWRVVERSHLVVQIVDARNPLLFRSLDLDQFVQEVDPKKRCLLLVNKADLLTNEQFREWQRYFNDQKVNAIFWSAKHGKEAQNGQQKQVDCPDDKESKPNSCCGCSTSSSSAETDEESDGGALKNACPETEIADAGTEQGDQEGLMQGDDEDEAFVWDPEHLLALFQQIAAEAFPHLRAQGASFVIGMVGYPNVGKSMTVNRLLGTKKAAVSSTPGKTKHFQTLVINDQLTLCDCPGLVMPQFGHSVAEMLLNGILPIAHMRDYFGPIQLLCERVPAYCFQQRYSVLLPKGSGHAHDLLTALAFLKGFMSASGVPDCSRAARLILSEVVDGSLKWIAAPPNVSQQQFDEWTFATMALSKAHQQQQEKAAENDGQAKKGRPIGANLLEQLERRQLLLGDSGGGDAPGDGGNSWRGGTRASRLDKSFFTESIGKKLGTDMAHIQGGVGRLELAAHGEGRKKHWNRNKREKLRRLCAKNE